MDHTPRPRVFIGSSTEGLSVAKALQYGLDHSAEVTIWHQGVFGLSQGTLEDLVRTSRQYDFAVLVLTPDDLTVKRKALGNAPRDNVIFELGLFMGALDRERTFIVHSRDEPLELPSDLAGVTAARYGRRSDNNMRAALGPACMMIEESIVALGSIDPSSNGSARVKSSRTSRARADYDAGPGGGEDDNTAGVQRLRDAMLGDSERGLSALEVAELAGYSVNTVRAYLCDDDRRRTLGDAIRNNDEARARALAIVSKRRADLAVRAEQGDDEPEGDDDEVRRLRDAMLGDAERGLSVEDIAKLTDYTVGTVRSYLANDRRRKQLGDVIRADEKTRARALAIVSRRRRRAG